MEKSKSDLNSKKLKNLVSDFNLGMTEKTMVKSTEQVPEQESCDICLPPSLAKAFQRGLEDGSNDCNCGCGEEHDCAHHASSSGHNGCGGCNHHG